MNTSSDLKQSGIDAFFSKFNFFFKDFLLGKNDYCVTRKRAECTKNHHCPSKKILLRL